MTRIPPHNLEAERSVLGAALISRDARFEIFDKLSLQHFYNKAHGEIFEVIKEMHSNGQDVDHLTVAEALQKKGILDQVGGRGYLGQLTADTPSAFNATSYADIVRSKGEMRQLIEAASEIMEMGYDDKLDGNTILDKAEQNIFAIGKNKHINNMTPIGDVLLRNMEIISERQGRKGETTGVPSGLIDLDKKLGGFQPSDLVIIAARPSMGKTAFALNVAMNAALKADAKILIFSLEMSKEQLGQRLLAMESRIDAQKLNEGDLSTEDWAAIGVTVDRISKSFIEIDDTGGIHLMEIKNKCRRLKREKGLDLVILDYLQLMEPEKKTDNRQQEITALSRGLKLLAREINCPIIALSQLSRAPEQRKDHRPMLSDLRESGAIEQDADVVLFLYRDEFYNQEDTQEPGICEVNVAKHRNGPVGTVRVQWQSQYTRFVNYSSKD